MSALPTFSITRAPGAEKLWEGTVTIHPNAKTGGHHHGELESMAHRSMNSCNALEHRHPRAGDAEDQIAAIADDLRAERCDALLVLARGGQQRREAGEPFAGRDQRLLKVAAAFAHEVAA